MYHSERHTIIEVKSEDFKDEILTLRQKVWEQTDNILMQQIFDNGFYDEYDNDAFHWVIVNNEKIIASARLTKHFSLQTLPDYHFLLDIPESNIEFPLASFNRLVVDNKYQGQGLSDLLDKARTEKAIAIGCNSICVMTHGRRGCKLSHDGFEIYRILTNSKNYETAKENAKELLPAFYYKRTKNST